MQTRRTISKILPNDICCIELDIQEPVYENQNFDSIESLKSYEIDGVPFGMMVCSTITSALHDSFFDVIKYSGRINELLKNSIGLYYSTIKIIEEESVDHVFVWNGRRSSDGPLTYAASSKGIQFTIFMSGGKYNTILTRDGVHMVQDLSEVKKNLSEITNKLETGVDKFSIVSDAIRYFDYAAGRDWDEKLNYLGHSQFARSFERLEKKRISKDAGKKTIAVFTGTYSEFSGVPGYDDSSDFCKNFYDGVSFLQENIHRVNSGRMIIRWHPNSRNLNGNEKGKLASIMRRGKEIKNVTHIAPESNFDSYELIQECDVAVCFGTSISVEACLYGKPVVFIGHNKFEDLDCFYKPSSFDELISLLNSTLQVKNFEHALAWGYYSLNIGNRKYEFLQQHRPDIFYYGDKRLLPSMVFYRRIIGGPKNKMLNFLKYVISQVSHPKLALTVPRK